MSGIDCQKLPLDVLQDLLEGPGMRPPDDAVSNFDNPPNDNNMAYIVTGVCLFFSTMFVCARAHAVWLVMKKPGIIDYLMLVSYGLLIAYCCVIFVSVYHWGAFVHQWHFRFRELPPLLYLYLVGTNIFTAQIMLVKTNILMEWLRIFCPRGRRDYIFWGSHALSGINIIFQTIAIFAINFTCRPYEKNWDCTVPGDCFDSRDLYIFSAALSLVIDIVILVLPQKIIWGLQLKPQKKFGVASVFTVGILAIIAAAFRVERTVRYTQTQDATFVTSQLTLWTLAESTSGIMVFCMPVVPKVVHALKEGKLVSAISSRLGGSQNSIKDSSSGEYSASWNRPRVLEKQRQPVSSDAFSLPIQNFSTTEEDIERAAASVRPEIPRRPGPTRGSLRRL